jgi:hypothetical protein
VQLVQADVELPHDMRYNVHDQVRVQRSKDAFQAPPDAIVVELLDLFEWQVEPTGIELASPLGHAVHRFARDEQIVEQQQEDTRRSDLGACVGC